MVKVDENRIANIDGLPWQLSLLPTGYVAPRLQLSLSRYRDVKCLTSYNWRWRS
ncbi:hypothetical protein C7374_101295 [Falsochrobactrum ovis]|uniref:Uncharacterized protein n=1 Tax=Falsochrobactrum ovis TaxID=1293442 RepID=A0A364JZ30_9HYPH|nr:hypothetical protein C7374_101295 [Falsochrobactrum ovis]